MCAGCAVAKAGTKGGSPIDKLMERASRALESTDYFQAERLAARALDRAHANHDFEHMARIALPLQEARRQKRQLAIDSGLRVLSGSLAMASGELGIEPGCYLFQPPVIAADVRLFREVADSKGIPVLAIAREPLTREGKWPVVAVGGPGGSVSVRARVAPPWPLERVEGAITKDKVKDGASPPDVEWFESAAEAMGDAAIARLRPEDPAAWRVEDLLEFLDAHPDHEKLHQRLAENCRQAMNEPLPEGKRRRPMVDDPYSF